MWWFLWSQRLSVAPCLVRTLADSSDAGLCCCGKPLCIKMKVEHPCPFQKHTRIHPHTPLLCIPMTFNLIFLRLPLVLTQEAYTQACTHVKNRPPTPPKHTHTCLDPHWPRWYVESNGALWEVPPPVRLYVITCQSGSVEGSMSLPQRCWLQLICV